MQQAQAALFPQANVPRYPLGFQPEGDYKYDRHIVKAGDECVFLLRRCDRYARRLRWEAVPLVEFKLEPLNIYIKQYNQAGTARMPRDDDEHHRLLFQFDLIDAGPHDEVQLQSLESQLTLSLER